jgi:serine/threonine protein kinase/DNA-binding SARP family transcriptional activator
VRIRVLGSIDVADTTGWTAITNDKQRRILVSLLLAGRNGVSIQRLIDQAWPQEDAIKDPVPALRTYVNRIRTALGPDGHDVLVTRSGGYVLDVERRDVDMHVYEDLVASARTELDPYAALHLYDEADVVWIPEPFSDLSHEDWVRPDAVRLDALHITAQIAALELRLDMGRYDDVIASAQRLSAQFPVDDRLTHVLALALYRAGRQVDALELLGAHRSRLRDELGLDPPQLLETLELAILNHDPTLETGAIRGRPLRGYRLGERIGEGAHSFVYRATQPSVGREVAIKVIRRELANDPLFIRRFEAEAQVVARLQHPHIVPLIDFWRESDGAFLVMRFAAGGSLADLMVDGPLPVDQVLRIFGQLSSALDFAHRSGVVHRDIKPSNVLLDAEGNAYLSDFGIALADQHDEPVQSIVLGSVESPIYAAPEQFENAELGPFTDVYAMGILLYEMVMGELPWSHARNTATLVAHHDTTPIPKMPERLSHMESVIVRATATIGSDRYQTLPEMAAALDGSSDGAVASEVGVNPFRGLSAFEEADAAVFFGRQEAVEALLGHINEQPLTLLVGPSGSGKSSVLRAGVMAQVRSSRACIPTVMVPGSDPFDALSVALETISSDPSIDVSRCLESMRLDEVCSLVFPESPVLLVIDQAEELYTMSDVETAERFLAYLAQSLSAEGTTARVVMSIRADFYGRPLESPTFGSLASRSTVPLAPPSPEELAMAVLSPAAAAGVGIDADALAAIVGDAHVDGSLPLLQFCLTEMWDTMSDRRISIEGYRQVGGLTGALARRAEEMYVERGPKAQKAVETLLCRLVQLGESQTVTRRRESLSEMTSKPGMSTDLIDGLVDARLVTTDRHPISREPTIEISHEAIVEQWPRYGEWLTANRADLLTGQHVRDDASRWIAEHRDPSAMYRGPRLERALVWSEQNPDATTLQASEFLEAAMRMQHSETVEDKQTAHRLRWMAAVSVVLAVAVAVAGVMVWRTRQQRNLDQASIELAELTNRVLVEAEDRTDLSLLLAVEAYRFDDGPSSQEALLVALRAAEGTTEVLTFAELDNPTLEFGCWDRHAPGVILVQPHTNGSLDDGGAQLIEIDLVRRTSREIQSPLVCDVRRTREEPGSVDVLYGGMNSSDELVVVDSDGAVILNRPDYSRMLFTPDSNILAKHGPLRGSSPYDLIDQRTGETIAEAVFTGDRAVLSPGGRFVSVIVERKPGFGENDVAVLLDSGTYQPVVDMSDQVGRAISGSFSADDGRFGYISTSGQLLVWDTETSELVIDIPVSDNPPPSLMAMSPDGALIGVHSIGGAVEFRSGSSGEILATRFVDEAVIALEWIDTETIAALRSSGLISVLSLRGGGIHDSSVRIPSSSEFGWVVPDGERPFAFYASFEGVDRLVDVESGGSSTLDVARWALDPYADVILTGDRQHLFMKPDGDFILVDEDGTEVAVARPFGSQPLLEELPDFAYAGNRTDAVWAFLGTVAGTGDAREVVQVVQLDITTLEQVGSTLELEFEASVGVSWAKTTHEGVIYIEQANSGNPRGRMYELDGELIADLTFPEPLGWVRMSYDRRYVLTASIESNVIRLYDLEQGTDQILPIDAEPQAPEILEDGRFLLQTRPGEYELWLFDGGKRVGSIAEPGPLAFTGPSLELDGSAVWIALDGHWTRIELDPETWVELACGLAGRSLTIEEWGTFVPGDREYRDACTT